jgi:hypothetical protein
VLALGNEVLYRGAQLSGVLVTEPARALPTPGAMGPSSSCPLALGLADHHLISDVECPKEGRQPLSSPAVSVRNRRNVTLRSGAPASVSCDPCEVDAPGVIRPDLRVHIFSSLLRV